MVVTLKIELQPKGFILIGAESTTTVGDVRKSVVKILNNLALLKALVSEVIDLANHGPMRPEERRLLDFEEEEEHGPFVDETKLRTGILLEDGLKDVLSKTANEIHESIDQKRFDLNQMITEEETEDLLMKIKGATMIAYPMGLPADDRVALLLDQKAAYLARTGDRSIFDETTATLFFARTALTDSGATLQRACGATKTCRLTLKISNSRHSTPYVASNPTDQEQAWAMKKAFEQRRRDREMELEAEDDVDEPEWADSNALHRSLHGLGSINWR